MYGLFSRKYKSYQNFLKKGKKKEAYTRWRLFLSKIL